MSLVRAENSLNQTDVLLDADLLVLLDADLLLYIFNFLADEPHNLAPLMLVSKFWHSISTNNSIWRQFVKNESHKVVSIFSLWKENIHTRQDTYYCVARNLELNSSLSFDIKQLKEAFLMNPEFSPYATPSSPAEAEELRSCGLRLAGDDELYPIFPTLKDAIDFADANADSPDFNYHPGKNLQHYPPIFVVQCRKFDAEEHSVNINCKDYSYIEAYPGDFIRVYQILYKNKKNQIGPVTIQVSIEEQKQFIMDPRALYNKENQPSSCLVN